MLLIQTSVVALSALGVVICYATSKHQRLWKSHLAKKYAVLGAGLLLVALYGWLQIFSTAAALFTWSFTVMALLICLPLLTLLSKKDKH